MASREQRTAPLALSPVTTPLTAFPADGYTARWHTWDHQGNETLALRWENEGWTATGEVGREAVTYVIRLSATWQVRQFLLFHQLRTVQELSQTPGVGKIGRQDEANKDQAPQREMDGRPTAPKKERKRNHNAENDADVKAFPEQ